MYRLCFGTECAPRIPDIVAPPKLLMTFRIGKELLCTHAGFVSSSSCSLQAG